MQREEERKRKQRKRDKERGVEEERMSGGLAADGQQRVLSKERMKKIGRKMDGQINAGKESQEIPGLWPQRCL